MASKFWASYQGNTVGPYKSREEAEHAFFENFVTCTSAIVGYGEFGPHFDMRFSRRAQYEEAFT